MNPNVDSKNAQLKNIFLISFFCAPIALHTPISFLLSVTIFPSVVSINNADIVRKNAPIPNTNFLAALTPSEKASYLPIIGSIPFLLISFLTKSSNSFLLLNSGINVVSAISNNLLSSLDLSSAQLGTVNEYEYLEPPPPNPPKSDVANPTILNFKFK